MATSKYPGPVESLERYEALVAGNDAVDRKGAKTPYTSRNGHMFSFLDTDGKLAIRMAPDRAEAFLAAYESGPVEQHGRTMRGYVSVPSNLLEDTNELQAWFDDAHEWTATLKPKATKKSKPT